MAVEVDSGDHKRQKASVRSGNPQEKENLQEHIASEKSYASKKTRSFNKPFRENRRRVLGTAFSLISLVILTYIALTLISGRELGLAKLIGIFKKDPPIEAADEFYFDVGRNRVFASLEGYFAAAGSSGVQVLNESGAETLREPVSMSYPAISATEGWAIAFDIGGTAVRAFNGTKISAPAETGGTIVSASVNRNGWYSICAQGNGAYNSVVTVYNNSGNSVYRISLATGHALSSRLSPDNRKLALLNLTDGGSKIVFYDLSSEEPEGEYFYPGGLILDIRNLPGAGVLAVATDCLIAVGASGEGAKLFDFGGRRLGGYQNDGSLIALHLYDYGVGYSGTLLTLDGGGKLLGGVVTDKEIISMSLSGGYLAVLNSDGPAVYDMQLNLLPPVMEREAYAGASQVIPLRNGAVFAAGDHFAVTLIGADQ